jgi:hypothetical protein
MAIFRNPGFLIHLIVYVAVNTLLVAINLINTPERWWFYWPLIGWGMGLIAHGAAVYFSEQRKGYL